MNAHLVILSNERPLALPEDMSLDITDQNPLFHDDEMYSLNVQVPLNGNRHIFKNVDDRNAEARMVDHEHTPMRVIADGIPFRSGLQVVAEEEEVRDSVSFNIDAQLQSFRDLIGDLKCLDVPIPAKYKNQLLIGEKIGNINVSLTYKTAVEIQYQGKKGAVQRSSVDEKDTSTTIEPQALGFSYPAECEIVSGSTIQEAQAGPQKSYKDGISVNTPIVKQSYINVDQPYPLKPFCNARICYAHHKIGDDGKTSDEVETAFAQNEDENFGKLWALSADRPQSGICFYLLFFLDCLFEHLGVQFDGSAISAIGDLRRLCFFTTKCAYDTQVKTGCENIFSASTTDKNQMATIFKDANTWLSSRGCGGELKLDLPRDKSVNDITVYNVVYERIPFYPFVREVGDRQSPKHYVVGQENSSGTIQSIVCSSTVSKASYSASVLQMYANNRNFPAESVSSVIDSLEQQFGIKFAYNYEQKKVTAFLLRDIFRTNADPRPFHATISEMIPVAEKITGVRAGYSMESDIKEQRNNLRDEVKDYETDYDYIEYPKDRTITDKTYIQLRNQETIHSNQMNVFIDLQTGNKYRVKIDSDYTDENTMEPRLFEVGGNKGVEVGDCSPINEDFIIELKSEFQPVPMVDINYGRSGDTTSEPGIYFVDSPVQPTEPGTYNGYVVSSINPSNAHSIMAAFTDKDMEHEFLEQRIKNPISAPLADFFVLEVLKLSESYDPTKTADGNSPLQEIDWGLSIAIMRGGGSDSITEAYDLNYDGFGNSKWRTKVGQYALTTDSIDPFGNHYDYNGDDHSGIGNEERFSLKPRAWVQPEWADAPLIIDDPLVKKRGYVDTFLIEYIYFLLHRKKFRVKALCSVAQLADVPNHWKDWWNIDGKRCLIDKMDYTIDAQQGISEVTLDVYSI